MTFSKDFKTVRHVHNRAAAQSIALEEAQRVAVFALFNKLLPEYVEDVLTQLGRALTGVRPGESPGALRAQVKFDHSHGCLLPDNDKLLELFMAEFLRQAGYKRGRRVKLRLVRTRNRRNQDILPHDCEFLITVVVN